MHLPMTCRFAAGAALLAGAAGVQPDRTLTVVSEGGRWSLALGDQPPFHSTDRPIIGPRTMAISGGPLAVALWGERQPDGSILEHHAVAPDGRRFLLPGPSGPHIRLRFARFDGREGEPPVRPALRAGPSNELFIVQFSTRPLDAYRRELTAAGATVCSFLPSAACLVRMDPLTCREVRSMPFVRWVGPFHPAYKLGSGLVERAVGGGAGASTYTISVLERGLGLKRIVAAKIAALGGRPEPFTPHGFVLRAALTPAQLAAVASMNEVEHVDEVRPIEPHMDVAREVSGANYIQSVAGFTGQGVRGEVCDGRVFEDHVAFPEDVVIHGGAGCPVGITGTHGTNVFGIVFGDGTGSPVAGARGLLPDAEAAIFAGNYHLMTGEYRYAHTAELVDPAGYGAVFQSNSWGTQPNTVAYTVVSRDLDDILFRYDLLVVHSQGNRGHEPNPRLSGDEAWAKNVVSVGGVKHGGTFVRADDCWEDCCAGPEDCCGVGRASTGPAADGRVKPDLVHFYDTIATSSCRLHHVICPDPALDQYDQCFGGTSAAAAIVAGCFGLFFQMWQEGVFSGSASDLALRGGRPHMTTAKAMIINTAYQYEWNAGGRNADLTRFRQGWGMPDLRRLHSLAVSGGFPVIINESVPLGELQSWQTPVRVADGASSLKATLTWADPAGSPNAVPAIVNDLHLKITSPDGTVYVGNNGLMSAVWSDAGGGFDTINTVENIFIRNPGAGSYRVEVIAAVLGADGRRETPAVVDADFALVVSVAPPGAGDGPPADWDGDGMVGPADVASFAADYRAGRADVDGNDRVDGADFAAFMDLWRAGGR